MVPVPQHMSACRDREEVCAEAEKVRAGTEKVRAEDTCRHRVGEPTSDKPLEMVNSLNKQTRDRSLPASQGQREKPPAGLTS